MHVAAAHASLPRRETRSICCYCGVGCGVVIESGPDRDGIERIVGARGDETHPANFGRLCSKGSTLHLTAAPAAYAQARALRPEFRRERGLPRTAASWEDTLDHVAARLGDVVQTHGPDAIGVYISG